MDTEPQPKPSITENANEWKNKQRTKRRNKLLFLLGGLAAVSAAVFAFTGLYPHGAHHAVAPIHHVLTHRPDMTPDSPHLLKHRPDMTPDSNPIHDAVTQHLNRKEMGGEGSSVSPLDAIRHWMVSRGKLPNS